MKKFVIFSLIFLVLCGTGMSLYQEDSAWAKKVTYYLSKFTSTSTKTFTINGAAGKDTTAVFELMDNVSFLGNFWQPGDSVKVKVILQLLPNDYRDSTAWVANIDTATVSAKGVQLLKFAHYEDNYLRVKTPYGDFGRLIIIGTDSTNGFNTHGKIRLMGATEGDF